MWDPSNPADGAGPYLASSVKQVLLPAGAQVTERSTVHAAQGPLGSLL